MATETPVKEPQTKPEVEPKVEPGRVLPDPDKTLTPRRLCPAQRETITQDV
jgi:hypothetical protein